MATLTLYLKGSPFKTQEIKFPEFQELDQNESENFRMNCELKEEFVKAEATKFKLLYLRQIIKCAFEYEIYLTAYSTP